MKNQTISFSTGNLIISDAAISFHSSGQVTDANTISRENISHIDIEPMKVLPKSEFTYSFRISGLGALVAIIGLARGMMTNTYTYFYIGLLVLAFGAFLLFAYMWLDSLLGLSIARPIFYRMFGVEAIRVTVQNKIGLNSLQLLIRKDEESKLPNLMDFKINTESPKPVFTSSNTAEIPKNEINSSKEVSEIERLAWLKEKGYITDEEFQLKKKKILGI